MCKKKNLTFHVFQFCGLVISIILHVKHIWNFLFCLFCFFPFREVRLSIKINIKTSKQVCTAPYFKNSSELAYLEGALESHSYSSRKSWQAPLPGTVGTFYTGAVKEHCCPLSLGDLPQCSVALLKKISKSCLNTKRLWSLQLYQCMLAWCVHVL